MDLKLVQKLKDLNRKFYSEVAVEFDRSREKPWTGWYKVQLEIENEKLKIDSCLDIACGNGRFGSFVSTFAPKIKYTGIDFSAELIDAAKIRLSETSLDFSLLNEDVIGDWDQKINEKYDLVVLFGILHHIPGLENRKKLIEKASTKLKSGGMLVATAWQIPLFRRFQNKMVDTTFIKEELGIDTEDFEENDFILDWQRGKVGYRYSHYSSPEEIEKLIENTGLKIYKTFESDGRTDNINRYYILKDGL